MDKIKISKKIFVIEDDERIAELIKIVLETRNYSVKIYTDGETGRHAIFANPPDLILLDLWLPGVRGETLAALLKTDNLTKNIPVILISAQSNLPTVAKKIKVENFLSKPFNITDLQTMVANALGN